MYLRWRPATLADLRECMSNARDHFAYDDKSAKELLTLWQKLLPTHSVNFSLVEDLASTPGHRIIWFSFKVFIHDWFADHLTCTQTPVVALSVLHQLKQNKHPLLTHRELADANARHGANMLVLNYGTRNDILDDPQQRDWAASKCVEWLPEASEGYRLKRLLIEFYGDHDWHFAQGFGLRPINCYQDGIVTMGHQFRSREPKLHVATPEDAMRSPGTPVSLIFRHQKPRFFFSPSEQELLLFALSGDTDECIADLMSLSHATVRKRWQAVFDRAGCVDDELLGRREDGLRCGPHKRRVVVNYLRQHVEELRACSCLS